MIEKRKLTQYEKIILASAYNLQNYCGGRHCGKCIFYNVTRDICILSNWNPYLWPLNCIDKEGDNNEKNVSK